MAIGDAAAAAGLPVVPATKDIRLGYQDINAIADALANQITGGTIPWARVSGRPNFTVSDSGPSGGTDGDVWYEF
jgi:hypothetical protein